MRRRNLFWGGVLILLGVLFMLDNFNLLAVNIWGLFWPLLIIWVGLQMLFRPRRTSESTFGRSSRRSVNSTRSLSSR